MSPLAERLRTARRRRFVGRNKECTLFQMALRAPELPFCVLHVFGPGGVGKTSLLQEFIHLSEQAEIPALYLDARNIEPTTESFERAWQEVQPSQRTPPPRQVLLLDTYELMAPLDDWLRDEFLPHLPEQTLVVLAGRYPPSTVWRTDPGWQDLVRLVPLRNLNPDESRTYLRHRAIPQTQHQAVLDFTHGYPLALSLIVDVFAQTPQDLEFQPEAVSDVVKVLLERLIQEVPSSTHRMALEACALIRLTTETLLAGMLDIPDVHELFEWLRGLSFIEFGTRGIFPHDLAREVLIADLRWRNPDRYAELHQRARNYYTTRLQQTQGQEQHAVLFDYIFLHRDNPAVRPRFTWQEHSSLSTDTMRLGDQASLAQMVAQQEGEASAQLATYWFKRQPEGVLVFRNAQQEPAGFVFKMALHQTTAEDRETDPATQAAWNYLQNHAPLRAEEGATLFRFWMAADTYQEVSPTQSLIFINFVQHHRLTPVAYTFFVCANPDFWAAMFAYADLTRLPEVDFEVGGHSYGVYGHDWRVVPPKEWQALLAQREIAASAQAITPSTISTPLLVLSQPDFVEAVQEVLRAFTRPDVLHNHPLLQSRLVLERVGAQANKTERIIALQNLVQEAAASLQASPREAKGYRAVYHTYLQPAPTQEQAAEILDIPFSSFRRHLKTGMTRIAEILWHQEIG
jgi:hypothetical protein